jgi:predicted PurR-regulated permease PerM
LVFPVIAGFWTHNHWGSVYVLILYAIVMVLDGFVLQPWIMKRTAKVPFWASLLTPIVIMLLIPTWWAILLAPPLLAVVFAFRRRIPSAKT